MRFYGVNNLEEIKPEFPKTKIKKDALVMKQLELNDLFCKNGFNEVRTYQLLTSQKSNQHNIWQKEILKLNKNYSIEQNSLRASLLSGLLETFQYNYKKHQQITDLRFFEIGNIFFSQKSIPTLSFIHNEHINIEEPSISTKLLLMETLQKMDINMDHVSFLEDYSTDKNIFNMYNSCVVKYKDEIIAKIGEIHPKILREYKFIRIDKIKTKLYFAEILLDKLV